MAYDARSKEGAFYHPTISRDNTGGWEPRLADYLVRDPPQNLLVGCARGDNMNILAFPRPITLGIHSTISKDNTAGEAARQAGLLAHLGKKTRNCVNQMRQQDIGTAESVTSPLRHGKDPFDLELMPRESQEIQADIDRHYVDPQLLKYRKELPV